jgi:hypothetical protein
MAASTVSCRARAAVVRCAGTVALIALVVVAAPAAAQTDANGIRIPRRIYAGLFAGDARTRIRPRPLPAAPPVIRERRANRTCDGCADRPGTWHVVFDSPLLTDAWLAAHAYQSNGATFGDNTAVADFWYDAVHRRVMTRSAAFHEVGDPADVRLGRAPGEYPNGPDFNALLDAGTTVGQVGFESWTQNGFSAYFAAVQGAVQGVGTGYLDLSTATGENGRTRTGSTYGPKDLIKQVRLHPPGVLVVGFVRAPDARPASMLTVRGNATIDGGVTIAGDAAVANLAVGNVVDADAMRLRAAGGNVPHACVVRTATGMGTRVVAACEAPAIAIGGGGSCGRGELRGTQPVQSGATPDGWEVSCAQDGTHTASVICCAQ